VRQARRSLVLILRDAGQAATHNFDLSDPSRTASEKLKTIIRQPFA